MDAVECIQAGWDRRGKEDGTVAVSRVLEDEGIVFEEGAGGGVVGDDADEVFVDGCVEDGVSKFLLEGENAIFDEGPGLAEIGG